VVDIPPEQMSRPLRGIDATGRLVLQNNLTEIAVLSSLAPFDRMVLGKAFLSEVSRILRLYLR
jgi:hypothetical protein